MCMSLNFELSLSLAGKKLTSSWVGLARVYHYKPVLSRVELEKIFPAQASLHPSLLNSKSKKAFNAPNKVSWPSLMQ